MNRHRYHGFLTRLPVHVSIVIAVFLQTSALRTTSSQQSSQHRLDPNTGISVRMTVTYDVPLRIDQSPSINNFGAPDFARPPYAEVPSHVSHVRSTENSGFAERRGGSVSTIWPSEPLVPSYAGGSHGRSDASTCTPPTQCRTLEDCATDGNYPSCGLGRKCCPEEASYHRSQNSGNRNPTPKVPIPTKSGGSAAVQEYFDEGLPAAFHGYLLLSEHPQMPQPALGNGRAVQSGNTGPPKTKSMGRTKPQPIIDPEYESGRYGGPPIRLGSAGTTPLQSLKKKEKELLPDDETCGFFYVNSRIIKGKDAELGELPWMALLGFRSPPATAVNFICAGTIISKRYVLTAAHCFTNQNVLVEVRLGEYDLSKDPDGAPENRAEPVKKEEAEEVILHPSFSRSQLSHDIALIRLKNQIREYTYTIKPICLPFDVSFMNLNYTVAGWGKTDYSHSNGSNIIQKTFVTLMNHTDCLKRAAPYNLPLTTDQICAGGNQGHDVCSGDSGGPLTKEGNANSPGAQSLVYIVGIVSFGADMPCGTAGLPSVFTKVTSYLSWILENIRA